MRFDTLLALLGVIVPLSLLSIGGGASLVAPLHHDTVELKHWLTQREFIDFFAISRAAPGPGALIVALIGWKVAGWTGAIVATLAMFVPTSILCYQAAHVWNRYRGTRLHSALETGLAPIGLGLMLAGAIALLRSADATWLGWLLALGTGTLLVWRNIHPLVILAFGGISYAIIGGILHWA